MINFLAVTVFVLGYIGITLEHKLKMSKSAFALLTGGILWILVALQGGDHFREEIMHSGAEIFDIVVFLLAAMSLVEILVHYNFFDIIRGKIYALGLDEKKQFLVISVLAFFLSAIIDNLTTTIVMIQISRQFFKGPNLLVAVASVVINANAGGAFSPLGDVTTIMLWLAGKFSAPEVITYGFLPSLAILFVSTAIMVRQIKGETTDSKKDMVTKLSRSEKTVITVTFLSFAMPLLMSFIKLPPYVGLLIGLGVVWIIIDGFKQVSKTQTHMEVSIEHLIQKTDISSLKFFIGILLAVSALNSLGLLSYVSDFFYGVGVPSADRVIIGNIGLGLLSAVLDNVPLTAIAIEVLTTEAKILWVLLAITVGTGGSLLVVGSAAGVIAMGMVKELEFGKYIKIAFIPALLGYFAAVGVWYLQYLFIV